MTLQDRTEAWNALYDPATTATQLAEIAGAHPEFAGTIAQHPNAYPALVDWARSRSAPAAVRPATRRSDLVWIVTMIVYLVVPTLLYLVAGLVGPLSFGVTHGYPFWYVLYIEWPLLLFPVAAAIAAPDGRRRGAGAACGAGGFVVLSLLACANLGVFSGAMPQSLPWLVQLPIIAVAAALLFLSWALTRPLVGVGYAAVAVAIVIHCLLAMAVEPAIDTFLFTIARDQHLSYTVVGVFTIVITTVLAAIEIAIVAVVALALNRTAERNAAARPVAG